MTKPVECNRFLSNWKRAEPCPAHVSDIPHYRVPPLASRVPHQGAMTLFIPGSSPSTSEEWCGSVRIGATAILALYFSSNIEDHWIRHDGILLSAPRTHSCRTCCYYSNLGKPFLDIHHQELGLIALYQSLLCRAGMSYNVPSLV